MTMSLLVTSCTMGKQPDRLLDKGPSYLRTRTNTKLFTGRRRSAVELLAATRTQYVKSDATSGSRPASIHFSDSFNIFGRSSGLVTTAQPSRSKSEHNLKSIGVDGGKDEFRDECDGVGKDDELKLHRRQQNPCKRTQHKPTETVEKKINMTERNSEVKVSDSKVGGWETSAGRPVDPDIIARDSLLSASYPNPRTMAADKSPGENTEQTTGGSGESEVDRACTPVHRSHSDLNCRHVRDSSISSSRSGRYSRASADLENFFNQMGLERNVLDPMLRMQDGQRRDFSMFESVSSLDSPDTRSISSGISHSEKGFSDTDADKANQNTSVVERNARIIKWLCNVKKAKTSGPGHT